MFNQEKRRKFLKRTLFAVILMPIPLIPIIYGDWLFLILLEILALISIFELINMYQEKYNKKTFLLLLSYPIATINLLVSYLNPDIFMHVTAFTLVFILTMIFIGELFIIKEAKLYFKKTFFLRVVTYSSLFLPYLLILRNSVNGGKKMLLLLSIIWAYDSCAYVVGVAFGKHKLMPSVSPKKSIEGVIGGFVGSFLAAGIIVWIFPEILHFSFIKFLFMMIIMAFLAQAGDLIESLIKRLLSAKDSGSLIPGHGGILDRLDSFFLVAPAFYFLVENVLI